ncbi:MAG: NfeD family protein, partial [Balneolaceae bacterium]
GGAVAFFLGALMLFQDLPEDMQISLYWLIPATLLTVAFFAWIVIYGIKAQFGDSRTGLESTIGKTAEVSDTILPGQQGRVFFDGEYWTAESSEMLNEGEFCEIVEYKGLKVVVKPLTKQKKESSNG